MTNEEIVAILKSNVIKFENLNAQMQLFLKSNNVSIFNDVLLVTDNGDYVRPKSPYYYNNLKYKLRENYTLYTSAFYVGKIELSKNSSYIFYKTQKGTYRADIIMGMASFYMWQYEDGTLSRIFGAVRDRDFGKLVFTIYKKDEVKYSDIVWPIACLMYKYV
jgi:hypothetical protein